MKFVTLISLTLIFENALSQSGYKQTFVTRLDEITKLEYYDNSVVIFLDDSSKSRETWDFPYWKAQVIYYEGDWARYKSSTYEALVDTKGQRPDKTPKSWRVLRGPHPYLFLRDSAETSDLRGLLSNEHPYIRIYAFGALSFRREKDLFDVIVNNLKDKTYIEEYTGDVGDRRYPADLMITYELERLTKKQKKELIHLITTKYHYLDRSLKALQGK